MAWDRVHTVNGYYDGPRLGIADVDGVPHIYEAEFDHSSDEYGDTYFVSPVDESLLALVLEDWEIWVAELDGELPHGNGPFDRPFPVHARVLDSQV